MSERELVLAQEGFSAWRRGDFSAVESLLDSSATWRWWEPGEWDCENRDEVLETLRERYEQGFGRGEIEFLDAGPGAVILVSHPREIGGEEWPEETATVVAFDGDRVVRMQDYPTQAEALAAMAAT